MESKRRIFSGILPSYLMKPNMDRNKVLNWTKLATEYGVQGSNRGRVVKQFLAENDISVAKVVQRSGIRLAKMRLPGGEISQPTHSTVKFQKDKKKQRIESKDILLGKAMVPKEYTVYRVDKETSSIVETTNVVHGRVVPICDLNRKLLTDHSNLGIMRCAEADPKNLSIEDLQQHLCNINEQPSADTSRESLESLVTKCQATRYLKVLRDNGKVKVISL